MCTATGKVFSRRRHNKDNKNSILSTVRLHAAQLVCASSVRHNRVSALDGNVHCDQQSMTSGAEFPYCTTNTQRQATTLNRLFIFSSKYIQWAHHMLRTDMHRDSLLFCIFWWYANQLMRGKCDSFQIHQTAFWPSSSCALSPRFSLKSRGPRWVSRLPGETLIDKSIDMSFQQPRRLRWSYNRTI